MLDKIFSLSRGPRTASRCGGPLLFLFRTARTKGGGALGQFTASRELLVPRLGSVLTFFGVQRMKGWGHARGPGGGQGTDGTAMGLGQGHLFKPYRAFTLLQVLHKPGRHFHSIDRTGGEETLCRGIPAKELAAVCIHPAGHLTGFLVRHPGQALALLKPAAN